MLPKDPNLAFQLNKQEDDSELSRGEGEESEDDKNQSDPNSSSHTKNAYKKGYESDCITSQIQEEPEIVIMPTEKSSPKEKNPPKEKRVRMSKQISKTPRMMPKNPKNAEPSSILYVEGGEEYAAHFAVPPMKMSKKKTKKSKSKGRKNKNN